MTYFIDTEDLAGLEKTLEVLGKEVNPVAAVSINEAARFARKLGSSEIRRKINFKSRYVDDGRLVVSRKATPDSLEGTVTAKDRPTSLARFSQGHPVFGRQKVSPRVKVKTSGGSAKIRKGFFVRLRRGKADVSAENANVGMAVRLAEGERLKNKNVMVPFRSNVYLLYGPSVGQVYRTVSENTADEVSAQLAVRFAHNLGRRIDG